MIALVSWCLRCLITDMRMWTICDSLSLLNQITVAHGDFEKVKYFFNLKQCIKYFSSRPLVLHCGWSRFGLISCSSSSVRLSISMYALKSPKIAYNYGVCGNDWWLCLEKMLYYYFVLHVHREVVFKLCRKLCILFSSFLPCAASIASFSYITSIFYLASQNQYWGSEECHIR